MKIHAMLPNQAGQDCMETLCGILVAPARDPQSQAILHFDTARGNLMQIVFEERDTTCASCKRAWQRLAVVIDLPAGHSALTGDSIGRMTSKRNPWRL